MTLSKMLAKGWVEEGAVKESYRITPAGHAALKAKIPADRRPRSLAGIGLKGKAK